MAKERKNNERGAALVLALFALLLLSAIGVWMYLASGTETTIDSNYGGSLSSYYSARSGLEEVRDRVKYSSATGGLSDRLPTDIAGNANGVVYVLNPSNGEVVDPTDVTSRYFDDQLCHDYNSGSLAGLKCTSVPTTAGWMSAQAARPPASGPLGYKWVRINMKTNRIAAPYYVDQTGTSAPLDTRVCWDGQTEQLSPGGASPACDANGMQTVYMLTSLAFSGNARRLLKTEIVAPSIRPPGAVTMESPSSSEVLSSGTSTQIPSTIVDGRPHNLDGTVATTPKCSAVSSVATDNTQSTAQLEAALNNLRAAIVNAANSSCNANGSSISPNICTPALWWVRGTDSLPRFVTTTSTSGSSGSDGGSSGSSSIDGDQHSLSSGGTACTSSTANCSTGLNLAAPQLFALPTGASFAPHLPNVVLPGDGSAPFVGNPGNQTDSTVYQSGSASMVTDSIKAVNALISATQGQPNYFATSAAAMATSYGSQSSPAIVVVTDLSLRLTGSLSGYGLLVVPNNFDIALGGNLQWTGIVLVNGNGQFTVEPGGTGSITGALLLQAPSTANLQLQATGAPGSFRISYSCDAVDLPFNTLPMKTISSAEVNF